MTVWCAFPFNHELDVLEIKLATLDPIVDRFVISESRTTHAGHEKPLWFDENRDRFGAWNDKIIHLVDDLSDGGDAKARDWQQRSLMSAAVQAKPDDLVMMSDCDEIPNPAFWDLAVDRARAGLIATPRLDYHVLAMRWRWPETWPGSARVVTGNVLNLVFAGDLNALAQTYNEDVEEIWAGRDGTTYGPHEPPSYGWHFTSMGGAEQVQLKLASNFHRQFDQAPYNDTAHIEECILTGADLLCRPERQSIPTPKNQLPVYVLDNWDRFKHLW